MANPDVVLVFIGETGSGKSTCINYFANYFADTKYTVKLGFSEIFVVIPNKLFPQAINGYINSESNIRDSSKSQTLQCNEYDFVHQVNGKTRIKIVDTPGFNDTDGSRDDENIQNIIKAFAKLPFITAIIVTINGTVARLSSSIRTTLSQLRGSLPDNVFKNLFFIFTNCDDQTRNFQLHLIDEYKPRRERIFHMQNSLFSGTNRADTDNDLRRKHRMENNWQDSVDTMNDIMTEVDKTAAASTKIFVDMRTNREKLLADKANLITKQKSLLSIMHEFDIESERLRIAENNKKANENYTKPKRIKEVTIETQDYYSTVCNNHSTLQICHRNCSLGYQPSLDYKHFKNCAAARGRHCRHCDCSMEDHYHTYDLPVSSWVTIEQILETKKAAFDQATQQIFTSQNELQRLNAAKTALQKDADACTQGILNSIRQLKNCCSHYNFAEEMAATIQKLRQEGKIAQNLHAKNEFNNTADAIESLVKQLTIHT